MSNKIGEPDYDAIVVGAGVTGIYQIKRLLDLGMRSIVLEAAGDVGGTWYHNRYPGARFDSESVSYGYSFSKEILDRWHWKERFSAQPENLRYLNFVVDTFGLRPHMHFNWRVSSARFDGEQNFWSVVDNAGKERTCRFLILCLGLLSVPTQPKYLGADAFEGSSFIPMPGRRNPCSWPARKWASSGQAPREYR